ncbi:ABC transporter ATP-binding protein [Agromyces archimandritae]|uniref:ATP-binding cassette domain-containing protein n=1 Tax=Agromyces archimandritae TaxID=2781962 RepID=A0A975FMP9_9MICO|nr:ATP-binding cassette domain-containing protein [Agromyces archimandritae]QTX04944.1 ATP-binding cassette domain-containing protein [Agromyces archimandritae]
MSAGEILRLNAVDVVRNGRAILSGVELAVHAGEHWALIGPNGAGKSTILSLCGAVQHPTRGTVAVLGHRLGRVDIRTLRESIGHVDPRHAVRSALTARDVVLTGATGTSERMLRWEPDAALIARADELLERLGLGALADAAWPTMSQGERGRTLIARALLADPPLLLLDEPSTGLDVAAREQLLDTVDGLHRAEPELASILVTHHLEELPETTTHAVLVSGGRILAAGPAQEVLTTELVSGCFASPIRITHEDGRWRARADRPRRPKDAGGAGTEAVASSAPRR